MRNLSPQNIPMLVQQYVPSRLINDTRSRIAQSNDLHNQYKSSDMAKAMRMFLVAALAELDYKGEEEVVVAAAGPEGIAMKVPSKKASAKKSKPVVEEPTEELLFDSREEAIEALDMPSSRKDAESLKKGDIIKVVYGVGNEDPISFLGLPEKDKASAMKAKELLNLIYGD